MEDIPDRENPFDDNRGDDGDDEGQELYPMSSTTTRGRGGSYHRGGASHTEETSFIDNIDENTPLIQRERERDEAWERIRTKFPKVNPKKSNFTASIDDGQVVVTLKRSNAITYPLFESDGQLNHALPPAITKSLGPSAEEIKKSNDAEIARRKEKVKDLESARKEASLRWRENIDRNISSQREQTDELERENIDRNISSEREQIDELERENEAIEERMSLRDRVKAIFKKYGLTAFSVLTAVGAVIGVIVSNLKNGLSKLGKGIGDGFKSIGKKLGAILPGMVGAIASFLFRTAGEVVGFLAKNSWLLIVAAVMYFVEQVKNNKKLKK